MTERRAAKRYRCGGRVEIPRVYSRVPLFGVVVDVSEDGCGISVPAGVDFCEADAVGVDAAEEVLELRFKSSYLSFRAKGKVRSCHRHREYGGHVLGVWFTELTARGRQDIAAFIRDQNELAAQNAAMPAAA